MKVVVEIGKESYRLTLPERIVSGERFSVELQGKQVEAALFRDRAVLMLVSADGLERFIQLRRSQVTRLAGESEVQLSGELVFAGKPHYPQATLRPDLPLGLARDSSGPRPQIVRSQITGKILSVLVEVGQAVAAGQALLVIEAMKMENRVFSQAAGTVSHVLVKAGDAVQTGKELLRITP